MLNLYHYSDTELKQLLSSMVILVDTREQQNDHITGYFTSKKVQYLPVKLDVGDYSCMLPASTELGLPRAIYLPVAIERKNSLEELSTCFTADRSRFESELIRAKDLKLTLMVEDGSYENIASHNYRTDFNPKSFMGTLLSFKHRYNLDIQFVSKQFAGEFIRWHCLYFARELLK